MVSKIDMVDIIEQRRAEREGKIRRIMSIIKRVLDNDQRLKYKPFFLHLKSILFISDRTAKEYVEIALYKLKLKKEDIYLAKDSSNRKLSEFTWKK